MHSGIVQREPIEMADQSKHRDSERITQLGDVDVEVVRELKQAKSRKTLKIAQSKAICINSREGEGKTVNKNREEGRARSSRERCRVGGVTCLANGLYSGACTVPMYGKPNSQMSMHENDDGWYRNMGELQNTSRADLDGKGEEENSRRRQGWRAETRSRVCDGPITII